MGMADWYYGIIGDWVINTIWFSSETRYFHTKRNQTSWQIEGFKGLNKPWEEEKPIILVWDEGSCFEQSLERLRSRSGSWKAGLPFNILLISIFTSFAKSSHSGVTLVDGISAHLQLFLSLPNISVTPVTQDYTLAYGDQWSLTTDLGLTQKRCQPIWYIKDANMQFNTMQYLANRTCFCQRPFLFLIVITTIIYIFIVNTKGMVEPVYRQCRSFSSFAKNLIFYAREGGRPNQPTAILLLTIFANIVLVFSQCLFLQNHLTAILLPTLWA